MTNNFTQDMTGTGHFIKTDEEPDRYYDWMLWKLKQQDSEDVGNVDDKKHI